MATTRLPNDPESSGEIRPDPTLATPPTRQWCPVTAPRPPPRRHLRFRGGGTTVAAAEGARRAGSYLDGSQNPVFDAAAHWYHTGRQANESGAGSADGSGGRPGPVAGAADSGRVAASQRRLSSAGPPRPPPPPTPAALRARLPRRARLCGGGRAVLPRRRLRPRQAAQVTPLVL